jgi:hypothetical protein
MSDEKIREIYETLKNLKRPERIMLLITIIIELIERENIIVQWLKKELKEYEEEVRKLEDSNRTDKISENK